MQQLVLEKNYTQPDYPRLVGQSAEITWSSSPQHYHYRAALPDMALSCDRAEALLSAPLEDRFEDIEVQSYLHQGLRQYTYPNGLLAKNSRRMSRETRQGLRDMVPDMKNLVDLLSEEARDGEVLLPLRTADAAEAHLQTRERLVTMKPSRLVLLCQELGMSIDETGLWRIKGGDRHNRELRLYHLDELGADSVRLQKELTSQLFRRINLLSEAGVEVAFVPNEDMSWPGWLKDVSIGERKRPLPPKPDGLPRWEVAFREGVVLRRRIVPVVSWAAVGEDIWPYYDRRLKLEFQGSRLHYEERTRTLTLFSPVLGATLLANEIGAPKDIVRRAYQFFGRNYDRHHVARRRRSGRQLSRLAIAALPAIETQRDYGSAIINSDAFLNVHANAYEAGGPAAARRYFRRYS